MSIIVIGQGSYIAGRLIPILSSVDTVVVASSRPVPGTLALDLTHPELFSYEAIRPGDVVVLLASISSPDACRDDFARAHAVNVEGTAHFIRGSLDRGAKVVFFSSDTVYGGGGPFDENAFCNPAGAYGRMKREVEIAFENEPQFKAIRLSYVFSRDDKFTSYLRQCARTDAPARVFHPFNRCTVHIGDLCDGVVALMAGWDRLDWGVINVGGPQLASRADAATIFREIAAPRLEILVEAPPKDFYEARPTVIDLDITRFASLLGRHPRSLREAMIEEFPGLDLNR